MIYSNVHILFAVSTTTDWTEKRTTNIIWILSFLFPGRGDIWSQSIFECDILRAKHLFIFCSFPFLRWLRIRSEVKRQFLCKSSPPTHLMFVLLKRYFLYCYSYPVYHLSFFVFVYWKRTQHVCHFDNLWSSCLLSWHQVVTMLFWFLWRGWLLVIGFWGIFMQLGLVELITVTIKGRWEHLTLDFNILLIDFGKIDR